MNAMPARWAWCIWWPVCSPAATSCSTRSFTTTHLAQFGAVEIARERYHQLLASALDARGDFYCLAEGASGAAVLQAITQTS